MLGARDQDSQVPIPYYVFWVLRIEIHILQAMWKAENPDSWLIVHVLWHEDSRFLAFRCMHGGLRIRVLSRQCIKWGLTSKIVRPNACIEG